MQLCRVLGAAVWGFRCRCRVLGAGAAVWGFRCWCRVLGAGAAMWGFRWGAGGVVEGAGGVVVSFSAFYAGGRGFDSHIHQS